MVDDDDDVGGLDEVIDLFAAGSAGDERSRQAALGSRSSASRSVSESEPSSESGTFTEFVVNDRWLDCDVDFKHRDQVAPMHRHINFVRVDRDVFRDGVQNFLVENRDEIGIARRLSFMRQKNLQPFARYRRGCAAAKELEEIHAALRPKNLRKNSFDPRECS